jgi:hypothetical protein
MVLNPFDKEKVRMAQEAKRLEAKAALLLQKERDKAQIKVFKELQKSIGR